MANPKVEKIIYVDYENDGLYPIERLLYDDTGVKDTFFDISTKELGVYVEFSIYGHKFTRYEKLKINKHGRA